MMALIAVGVFGALAFFLLVGLGMNPKGTQEWDMVIISGGMILFLLVLGIRAGFKGIDR